MSLFICSPSVSLLRRSWRPNVTMSVLFPPLLWLYVWVLTGLPDFLEASIWLLIPSQRCPEKFGLPRFIPSTMTQFNLRQRLLNDKLFSLCWTLGLLSYCSWFLVLSSLCSKCPILEADALFQHSQPAVQGQLRSSLSVCVWISL